LSQSVLYLESSFAARLESVSAKLGIAYSANPLIRSAK